MGRSYFRRREGSVSVWIRIWFIRKCMFFLCYIIRFVRKGIGMNLIIYDLLYEIKK